jgi:peptidoglycan hydrolase-like protein with peptidoglycan-binding domain
MALMLPIIAGSALALTFLFTSGASEAKVKEEVDSLTDEEKEALKTTSAAVDAEDWMLAVAEAIRTNSEMAMKEVAEALKKAGLKEEAAELVAEAKKVAEKKKAKPKVVKPPPKLAKPTDKPKATTPTKSDATKAAEDAKKKEAAAIKAYQEKLAKDAAAKKAADAAKKKAADKAKADAEAKKKAEKAKLKEQAEELKKHLASTGRGKENKEYVKAYQKNNKLVVDGKYGPATARTFWSNYKLVPVNPFYWPATNTTKELNAYQAFLDSIVADDKKHSVTVSLLKKSVGK